VARALSSTGALLVMAALAIGVALWLASLEAPWPEQELGVVRGPASWRFTTALLGLSVARADTGLFVSGGLLIFFFLFAGQWSLGAGRAAVAVAWFALALVALSYLGNARAGVIAATLVSEDEVSSELTRLDVGGVATRAPAPFALQLGSFLLPPGAAARTAEASAALCRGGDGLASDCQQVGAGRALRRRGWTLHLAGYVLRPDANRYRVELGPRGGELDAYRLARGETLLSPEGGRLHALHYAADVGGLGSALRVRWTAPGAAPQSLLLFRDFPEVDARLRGGEHELRFLGVERRFDAVLALRRAPFTPALLGALALFGFALLKSVSWRSVSRRGA
jgi:hypothetical protein